MSNGDLEKKTQEAFEEAMADPSVSKNGDGTITIKLNRPIEIGNKLIEDVVTSAECTLTDIEKSENGDNDIEKARFLIASLTNLNQATAGRLRTDDMKLVSVIVGELAGKGHLTGGTC